eukprot:gene11510-15417_t
MASKGERKSELVDVFLNAKGLPNLGTFSKTDPFAVVYILDPLSNEMKIVGKTDVIVDSLDPLWSIPLTLEYVFECIQEYIVKVYHYHKGHPTTDFNKHTLVGECSFLMSSLMTARNQQLKEQIISKSTRNMCGELEVRGELRANTRDLFCVTFQGTKLANKDGFFGKSDPFLEISRLNEDGSYTMVFRSIRIDNNLNPHFPPIKILMTTVCNGDLDRPLKIQIWDYDSNGKHDSMGVVETSVRAMISNHNTPMDVIEADKKAKKSSYVNSGTLTAVNAYIEPHPSFSDFIAGGCEISVMVAIDFTGSNGDPSDINSLHHINPISTSVKSGLSSGLNEYQQSILSVGNVLEPYDSDKKYNVVGFGAKLQQSDGSYSVVQHCFPLSSEPCPGVNGILETYKEYLPNVLLSGPTLFGPLINHTLGTVLTEGCSQERQKYTILLIMTDGVINDLEVTKSAIIEASNGPMSIIIIGVGHEDFSSMNALDSDKGLLTSGSKTSVRDIVQFVGFRDAQKRGSVALSSEVLAEIPNQLLDYMQSKGIVPNPPRK